MNKKTQIKYNKQAKVLVSGLGTGIFSVFKKECGINQKLFIKKIGIKLVVKRLFAQFLSPAKKIVRITSYKITIRKNVFFSEQGFKENQHEQVAFLKNLRNYRGIRHQRKLPTRGQRTRTNAKTVSKKISSKRKKKLMKSS